MIIFATMKSVIKILLFILLSSCYINTIFEFSDNEKANFENESHCYIHIDNNDLTIASVKTIQHFYIAFVNPHRLEITANWKDIYLNPFYCKLTATPPTRLSLWHSSLLI